MADSAELLAQMRQKLDQFDEASRAAEQRAASYGSLATELQSIQASAQSPDRSITVVAGVSGSISEIRFTENAKRMSATQLSQAVMSTLRQAVAAVARQQAQIVQEHVGADIPIADRVAKTQEEISGQQPPLTRPRPPADDEDGGTGSIFGKNDRW